MKVSVAICTHNPREDYLQRVLEALRAQTLPKEQWELLLIDNGSKEPLAGAWDLSWHPQSRHVREDELGLTPARLRAIQESTGDLLVFVDDDNVLAANYLAEATSISERWPMLGVWGGRIDPGFEQSPPEWTRPYWGMLAIRQLERDKWSNLRGYDTLPCGAGMCVRRQVALQYALSATRSNGRKSLDRKGTNFISCGDYDLAFTACDLGYGTGQFLALRMVHLIPPRRLEKENLLKLREGISFSEILLASLRGGRVSPPSTSRRLIEWCKLMKYSGVEREMILAEYRGRNAALCILNQSETRFQK